MRRHSTKVVKIKILSTVEIMDFVGELFVNARVRIQFNIRRAVAVDYSAWESNLRMRQEKSHQLNPITSSAAATPKPCHTRFDRGGVCLADVSIDAFHQQLDAIP